MGAEETPQTHADGFVTVCARKVTNVVEEPVIVITRKKNIYYKY